MGTLIVKVAGYLVEDVMKTGNKQRAHVITKGLPRDAKLIGVKYDETRAIIELGFSTEKVAADDVKTVEIEITTFADSIEP